MTEYVTVSYCLNDAVLVPYAGSYEVHRVLAITDDGQAVVKCHGDYQLGSFQRVGFFTRCIFGWKFIGEDVSIPPEKKICNVLERMA